MREFDQLVPQRALDELRFTLRAEFIRELEASIPLQTVGNVSEQSLDGTDDNASSTSGNTSPSGSQSPESTTPRSDEREPPLSPGGGNRDLEYSTAAATTNNKSTKSTGTAPVDIGSNNGVPPRHHHH